MLQAVYSVLEEKTRLHLLWLYIRMERSFRTIRMNLLETGRSVVYQIYILPSVLKVLIPPVNRDMVSTK